MILTNNAYCATEFISTINKTGEDYNLLSTWEAAMDDAGDLTDGTVKCGGWDAKTGSIPGDAVAVDWDGGSSTGTIIHVSESNGGSGGDQYCVDVTSGTLADNDIILDVDTSTDGFTINGAPDSCIIVAECYDDDGDLDDTIVVDGFTTNVSNYVKITSPSGERHNGTAGSGFKLHHTSSASFVLVTLSDTNTVLEWLEITGSKSTSYGSLKGVYASVFNGNTIIRNNLLHFITGGNTGINGIEVMRGHTIYNNFLYNLRTHGILNTSYGTDYLVYNNTVFNFGAVSGSKGISIAGNNSSALVKNNLVVKGPDTHADSNCFVFENGTHDYNASSDATATGTHSVTSITSAVFTSATNLHIVSGAVDIIDDGVDLGTTNGVNIDIDGRDRDAEGDTWDIGADEYVAVVGGAPQIIFIQ